MFKTWYFVFWILGKDKAMSDQDILEVEYDLVISEPPGITFFLSWIYTRTLSVFSMLGRELQRFHLDSTPPLSDKILMQSIFR